MLKIRYNLFKTYEVMIMKVGQYIKELRLSRDMSQEELGKIIGVKRAAVQKWECGTVQNLKRTTIQKLAEYFGVSPATFVLEDTDTSSVKTTIGEKIKKLRTELGITQEELAASAGTTKQTIHKYETGIISNIPASKIKAISDRLQTTPAYLMGWEDISYESLGLNPIKTKKFPMLGEIACGEPIYANEEYETYIEASSDIQADFCLIAKGDSMINARIFNGDIVFIRQQPDVDNGEIAAVCIGDEVTLKRVYKYPNRLELRPENPTHNVQNYEGDELCSIRILGKAVAFQSYIK